MFDTYVTERTTEYVTKNINITEKRAPTDESVKLLNEMQDKAVENLVKRFSTSNNTLQITGAVYDNPFKGEKELHCKFVLNGQEHTFRVEVPSWECKNKYEMVEKLYKRVCEKLAVEIMLPFCEELNRSF